MMLRSPVEFRRLGAQQRQGVPHQLLEVVSAVGCHYVSIGCCSMLVKQFSYTSVFALRFNVLWLQARGLQGATPHNYKSP